MGADLNARNLIHFKWGSRVNRHSVLVYIVVVKLVAIQRV